MPAGGFGASTLAAGALAGGSIGSALIGANAAKEAASTQQQSQIAAMQYTNSLLPQELSYIQNAGTAAQNAVSAGYQNVFPTINSALTSAVNTQQPYLNVGTNATNTLADLYGLGPKGYSGQQAAMAGISQTPDYQFALSQGTQALDRSAASQGLLLTGGQLKDVQSYGQGLATQQYQNYVNRLSQLSSMGQNAANTTGGYYLGAGTTAAGLSAQEAGLLAGYNWQPGATSAGILGNNAQQVSGIFGNYGQAGASGQIGAANAITGGINSGMNNALLSYAMFRPGGIFGGTNNSGYNNNNAGGQGAWGNSGYGGNQPGPVGNFT